MGSVRNPVGPLPSSIYWRRRAVGLCLLAAAVVIVILVLNSGGGGGGNGSSGPSSSRTPVATITAGPAPSGTHISGEPGGRDTAPSDSGSSDDGTSGGSSGDTAGSDSSGSSGTTAGDSTGSGAGSDTGTGGTSGSSSAGSSGTSGGSSTTGGELAAGSTLPDCDPGPVTLALTSVQNSYSPGDTPSFQLRATNSGDITCKVDFGPTKAVFTVTKAADNSHVWASADCPTTGSYLMQVPAHGSTTYTLRWNEKTSSPKCASPKGQQADAGTYLIQAQMSGYGTKQVSFVLSAD